MTKTGDRGPHDRSPPLGHEPNLTFSTAALRRWDIGTIPKTATHMGTPVRDVAQILICAAKYTQTREILSKEENPLFRCPMTAQGFYLVARFGTIDPESRHFSC
jgi:hypothetical protein